MVDLEPVILPLIEGLGADCYGRDFWLGKGVSRDRMPLINSACAVVGLDQLVSDIRADKRALCDRDSSLKGAVKGPSETLGGSAVGDNY